MAIPAPVSAAYCVGYEDQLVLDQQLLALSDGKFNVKDVQGNILFKVNRKKACGLHERRLLRDPSGQPVVLMKKKILTLHDTWRAYRGKSDSDRNLLFTVKKSSIMQMKSKYHIFLARSNPNIPDFKVKGNFFTSSYVIKYGKTRIAKASRKINASTVLLGKEQFGVTISPGVDRAFIAAVVVIMDEIRQEARKEDHEDAA